MKDEPFFSWAPKGGLPDRLRDQRRKDSKIKILINLIRIRWENPCVLLTRI